MILVIGGFGAGKRAWVREHLGYCEAQFSSDPADSRPVLYGLEGLEIGSASELRNKQVVICDEIGCGLVPVDAGERARRERVGRLCVELAADAERVVRVICGIGTILKG